MSDDESDTDPSDEAYSRIDKLLRFNGLDFEDLLLTRCLIRNLRDLKNRNRKLYYVYKRRIIYLMSKQHLSRLEIHALLLEFYGKECKYTTKEKISEIKRERRTTG